jgi:phage gp46-like protein
MDAALSIIDDCIQMSLTDGDLTTDAGLETAVLISLFSDQRVIEEELPPGITFKRGWWGDLFPDIEGDQIGSKIWSLDRDKNTLKTVVQLENKIKDSLQWMLDDGVASEITVEVTQDLTNIFRQNAEIVISRPTGESDRFGIVWDEQELKRA